MYSCFYSIVVHTVAFLLSYIIIITSIQIDSMNLVSIQESDHRVHACNPCSVL